MLNYTLDSNHSINPSTRIGCKSCGLYLNQLPVFDKQKKSSVFWVGLSAVQFADDEEKLPLAPFTRSGALVAKIEEPFGRKVSFYKTNLVKCLPLKHDKIRYPIKTEMENCFSNFETELHQLKPKVVFLLGKQVASFILGKVAETDASLSDKFNYKGITVKGITYVPIHHPSYILVYKRSLIDDYIRGIRKVVKEMSQPKSKLSKVN